MACKLFQTLRDLESSATPQTASANRTTVVAVGSAHVVGMCGHVWAISTAPRGPESREQACSTCYWPSRKFRKTLSTSANLTHLHIEVLSRQILTKLLTIFLNSNYATFLTQIRGPVLIMLLCTIFLFQASNFGFEPSIFGFEPSIFICDASVVAPQRCHGPFRSFVRLLQRNKLYQQVFGANSFL